MHRTYNQEKILTSVREEKRRNIHNIYSSKTWKQYKSIPTGEQISHSLLL